MRIATYNVQSGGFAGYDSAEPQRLDALREAVHTLGADFIGLTDTYLWHEQFSTADLRAMFDYEHALSISLADTSLENGNRLGVTVLSRRELIEPIAVDIGKRDALATKLELDDGTLVSILTAYFHHASEAQRLVQAQAAREYLGRPDIPELSMLVGDLNSVGQNDRFVKSLGGILGRLPVSRTSFLADLASVMRGDTHQSLLNAGLRDANTTRMPTWPTPQFRAPGGVRLPPFLRPDHILHSRALSIGDATVAMNGIFRYASDHYPVSSKVHIG
jgi:endonuclease/exonuclease/phosphatase family metal-dependent hydrolase